jgi:hypothetical protein
MCPICIATAAWLSAGAGSAGGLTALLIGKRRSKLRSKTDLHRGDDEGRGDPPETPAWHATPWCLTASDRHSSAPRELPDHICLNRCR